MKINSHSFSLFINIFLCTSTIAYDCNNDTALIEGNLIWAASQNDLTGIKNIYQKGVNLNAKDKKGSASLHWASFKGHFNIVNFLLEGGAHVDIRDAHNKTPLQWASGSGHENIAQLLIDNDADLDLVDEKGDTALHWATFNKNNTIAKRLIDKNAEINSQNNAGITPLNTALIVGNFEIQQILHAKNAELFIDRKSRNPLHCAIWGKNKQCLNSLLKTMPQDVIKSFINSRDIKGETPLHYAAAIADREIEKILVDHGAKAIPLLTMTNHQTNLMSQLKTIKI